MRLELPRAVEGAERAFDLVLAQRCARGDMMAVALLRKRHERGLRAALERRGFGDLADDVLQHVFERASVGKPPDIARYRGRGSLDGWLRTVAIRTALNLRRSRRREKLSGSDRIFERATMASNPEVLCMERGYCAKLEQAVEHALSQLDRRTRDVLRRLYVDELNIDQIGALYGVHRATVARWRARAHRQLFDAIRRRFAAECDVSPAELRSIARRLGSQLDLSFSRLLE